MVNAQRLVDAVNDILEHPEKHKQGSWMEVEPQEAMKNGNGYVWDCGTGYCVAGSVCLAAGDKPYLSPGATLDERIRYVNYVLTVDGEVEEIYGRAVELLGITHHQSDLLFDANNTPGMIRGIAVRILRGTYLEETGDLTLREVGDESYIDLAGLL